MKNVQKYNTSFLEKQALNSKTCNINLFKKFKWMPNIYLETNIF